MNDLKGSDTQKILSTTEIKLMPSKDDNIERVMHSKSNDIKITINGKAGEFIEESFNPSFLDIILG